MTLIARSDFVLVFEDDGTDVERLDDDDDDDDDALLWTGRRCVYQTFVESGNALVYHREEKKTIVDDDRYRQHKGESFLCVFLSFPLEEVKKALLYN